MVSEKHPSAGRTIIAHTTSGDLRNDTGSLLSLTNGDLIYYYTAYQHGTHDWDHARIKGIISHDGGDTWYSLGVLFEHAEASVIQPSLVRMANGEIGVSYQIGRGFEGAARKVFRYSADEGQSWSQEIPLTDGRYDYMTGGIDRLICLSNRRLLAQTHAFIAPKLLGTDIFYSDDHGRSWHRNASPTLCLPANDPSHQFVGERGVNEATLVEYSPGTLLLLARTATGRLWQSCSEDYGTTWMPLTPTNIRHPQALPCLTQVPRTQTLLLLYNSNVDMAQPMKGERLILACLRSDNLGQSWHAYRQLENDGLFWHDYPTAKWVGDTLHLMYRSGLPNIHPEKFWMYTEKPWQYTDVRYQRLSREELIAS